MNKSTSLQSNQQQASPQASADDAAAIVARESLRLGRLNQRMENGFWDWELGRDKQWYSTRLAALLDYDIEGEFPNELLRLLAMVTAESVDAAKRVRWCLEQNSDFDERLNISVPDGQPIWIRLRGAVSSDDLWGEYCAGSIEDISDRVLLETERTRFAKELERSNAELESFAGVASHDLKAPLRHIGELANMLRRSEKDAALSPQADQRKSWTADISARVGLMDKLLSGLLDYAQVGRVKDRIEVVDLHALLKEVLTLLAPPCDLKVELKCSAAPFAANSVMLQQCIRNVLDNAVKHADQHSPQISVEAFEESQHVAICIHDNGAGIPEQQRTSAFELFKTFDQRDDTKGAGMGLAIVKKSVLANNGSVAVSDSPLGGACIKILWPKTTA